MTRHASPMIYHHYKCIEIYIMDKNSQTNYISITIISIAIIKFFIFYLFSPFIRTMR